jgi:phosphoglycolate phosphatase-like HAD superfamily hydrolase
LYVSSSAETEEIRAIAQIHGLDGFFQEIMGSRPGFDKGKEHIDFVLKKQGARKNQIIYVGDEPFDITIGREAGVLTIAKVGTYSAERLSHSEPDHVIASLSELPGILEQVDGREED